MFTILQARYVDDFQVFEAIDHRETLDSARDACAYYCDLAGVKRTIAVDELGSVVCVES